MSSFEICKSFVSGAMMFISLLPYTSSIHLFVMQLLRMFIVSGKDKTHKSSCSIGTISVSSGWISAGTTSYASATGKWTGETHAYYDYQN